MTAAQKSRKKKSPGKLTPAGRSGKQKGQHPAKKRVSPVMIAAIAVVVVAGIAAIVASTTARRGEETGFSETRPVSVQGSPLPPMPAEQSRADPAVGMAIPSITGQSFDGSPVEIAPGKAKVVVFLAHWCPHCQAEVPRLVSWMRENRIPDDVEVISVSTGVRRGATNYPPSRWLQREGWTPPVLADDDRSSAAGAFGVQGYPTFVVVSADGRVVARVSGEIAMEQWERMLLASAGSVNRPDGG